MSDKQVHLIRDSDQSLLEELWSTPVGRRWVLKAGLGSAVALGASAYAGPATAAARRRGKRPARTDLQFALRHARGVSDLVLVANGQRVRLKTHTARSRAALRAKGGLWAAIDLAALTHYATVELPAHRGMLLSVHGRRRRRHVVVSQMFHAPRHATLRLAATTQRLTGSLKAVSGSSPRLKALGLSPSAVRSPTQVADLETIGDSYQTATALTMLHPNVATIDPTSVAATKSVLGQTPEVQTLGKTIATMHQNGQDFATLVQVTDKDGSPSQIKVGDITTGFQTTELNTSRGFVNALGSSLRAGVVGVRDTASLGAVTDKPLDEDPAASTKTWVQPQGVLAAPQPYGPSLKAGAGIDINIKNTGFLYGTQTIHNGSFANGKVPLKVYNNFVRWIWMYVQYLGPKGENLSLNKNATFPDTKYSQSVAVIPQVFTVLGIPLWDTNTVEVELDFPKEAHAARIMYCGLGANLVDGNWRQYFPPDAYPDAIAPTDEVWIPALITGIMSIGLTIFALATDLNIAATWQKIRDLFSKPPVAEEALRAVLDGAISLTAADAATVAVASGGATYLQVKSRGENLDNLWGTLVGLGSVIPKVIFNARSIGIWAQVAEAIVGQEAADRIINAIPGIGETYALVSIAGDVATLAEVAAETLISPWVIENEVSLTYPVEVTVSRDPRSSTWPATARSWRLEALVDGALALDPITGVINQGGRIGSTPLVLDVSAPFGGSTIQWSLVLLDANGRQVGTGVSAQFVNNDAGQVASKVSFSITQIPATITASTVFKRADTTTYSRTAGGYTWSDQVVDTGTVASNGIQEVTGATVATLAGVAGAVWKQNGRYWLRGVPLAQNASTIELVSAPKEGYVRRPFLLFDAFVEKTDVGNHVLLEPQERGDGYDVRKVSLDPVSGALKWDGAVSYGVFQLQVSAAALHSSGRVVTLNTDSGRLGVLLPAATPRPPLATYTAGPGNQVGLLSSPIALAITNPGVVLILEAATSRIAAFDLNGNPVRYFNPSTPLRGRPRRRLGDAPPQYTLPLISPGTYLDLAVDGASQIYVLYYTGTGSAPSDYHVDVYTATGQALDTHSPGVNVPHLAVDYWRSIFAANYDPLTIQGTSTPRIDPALGVPEPSLSRFDPTEPKLSKRGGKHKKHGGKHKKRHHRHHLTR
jgi:hypothetical protein